MERFAEEDAEYADLHARLVVLAGWEPGPELAAALVKLAGTAPDCWSQLQLSVQWGRMAAWVEAQSMRAYHGALADGGNLHPLCRSHHNLKTSRAWDVTLHPDAHIDTTLDAVCGPAYNRFYDHAYRHATVASR